MRPPGKLLYTAAVHNLLSCSMDISTHNGAAQKRSCMLSTWHLHGRRRKVVKIMEEDLAQKRKQVLTLRQSMDKQSSSHVGWSELLTQLHLPVSCGGEAQLWETQLHIGSTECIAICNIYVIQQPSVGAQHSIANTSSSQIVQCILCPSTQHSPAGSLASYCC